MPVAFNDEEMRAVSVGGLIFRVRRQRQRELHDLSSIMPRHLVTRVQYLPY
jgi:hypothetical protein